MSINCSKCRKPAITYIRYNGMHLCREHFIEYVKRRVKKDVKKQIEIPNDATIGVAVSGGKDSLIALYLVHEIFSIRGNRIIAFTVDEGIKGYRDESIEFARRNCEKLGVEHHMVSFKEMIGFTLDEIVSRKKDGKGPCSYCGVFRRFCLNKKAKELGVKVLATGHNLDDMAQSALMNFVKGDIEKIARMGPHTRIQPGLIPRFLPLRLIPEKETTLFALINGVEYHDRVCPYSIEAFRGVFRDIVEGLENDHPGTRHAIFKSYETIRKILLEIRPFQPVHPCEICGEPTSQRICKACMLLENLKKK
ncbi:MAG: TIGR00269 family protein [Thermoplasmata archaeon]|nr:MAG: TIGR00269 family protein [Thermoplasmata archaeon]